MNLIKDTVINNNNLTPTEFYLSQNYPNPFKDKTTIKFCVAYKTRVKLEIFNSNGDRIKVLLDEAKEAGTYEVEFQSTIGNMQLANGIYFYRLEAGDFVETKEMLMIK
jgi:hypothetical protein